MSVAYSAATQVAPTLNYAERVLSLEIVANQLDREVMRLRPELELFGVLKPLEPQPCNAGGSTTPYSPTMLERLEWLEQQLQYLVNTVNVAAVALSNHSQQRPPEVSAPGADLGGFHMPSGMGR